MPDSGMTLKLQKTGGKTGRKVIVPTTAVSVEIGIGSFFYLLFSPAFKRWVCRSLIEFVGSQGLLFVRLFKRDIAQKRTWRIPLRASFERFLIASEGLCIECYLI